MSSRTFGKDSDDEILSEINVVPLVDISLVLLIIFMVTASYIMTSSFTVEIPKAQHAKETGREEAAMITITREGPVYLDNEMVTVSELRAKMKKRAAENQQVSVVLSADKNVNFKNVVGILDMLSALGITKLNIAAAREE